jgi:hypothetical protein
MRAFIIAAALAIMAGCSSEGFSQVNIGVSIGDRDGDGYGFYAAVGNYYRVPEREVYMIRDRRVREEEIPVVFYFAEMAHVRPIVIVTLRENGYTWMDIALRFRLSPSLFYDPAYNRHYIDERYQPGRGWGRIRFADDDFIRYCNVRFLTEHYHYRPEDVLRMREHQHDFFYIHNDIRREMEHHDSREVKVDRNDRHDSREVRVDRGDRHDSHEVKVDRTDRHDSREVKVDRRQPGDRTQNSDGRHDTNRGSRDESRNQNNHRSGRERE